MGCVRMQSTREVVASAHASRLSVFTLHDAAAWEYTRPQGKARGACARLPQAQMPPQPQRAGDRDEQDCQACCSGYAAVAVRTSAQRKLLPDQAA